MSHNSDIGNKGEEIAAEYLSNLGYIILERNWRYGRAEIDLIAKNEDILVFVEVKTRSSDAFGKPEEFISDRQQEFIFTAAQRYMEQIDYDWEIRFDSVSILVKEKFQWKDYELKHIKDVYH